MAVTCCD